jgi:hypothetical protein
MSVRATLYMKPGCHLCETTLDDLARLRGRLPHSLELVDITTHDELMRRYGERIPVLSVAGHDYDAPLAPAVLERALRLAASGQEPGAPTPGRAT